MNKKRNKSSGSQTEKLLRARSRASAAALFLSIALLAAIFTFSKRSVLKLEAELCPLIDEAMGAAYEGDLESAAQVGKQIDGVVKSHERALMICTGHRDLIDLLSCSGELAALGADGERDDYIEQLAALRVLLHLLLENNTVTLGNVL